jgi:hypothetical protein
MGGRRPADGRSRGGERIQAARTHARLILGAAAVVAAAGIGAYSVVESGRFGSAVAGLAAAGVVVLAAGVLQRATTAVTAAVAALGAAWTLAAWTQGLDAPAGTAVAAAALVLVAELGFAALEQTPVSDEPELVARRFAGSFGRAVGALVLAAVLLAALALPARGGLALEAAGVGASIAVLGLLFALAREAGSPER